MEKAIRLKPNNGQLYGLIGDEFLKINDIEKAERNYLMSINVDSLYSFWYYQIGGFYINIADDKIKEADDIYPDPREKLLIKEAEDLMIKAIPYLEKAAVEMNQNAELARVIAQCYKKKEGGDSENYQKWYNQYKKLKN